MNPDGITLHSTGYEAEIKYSQLVAEGENKKWYLFQNCFNYKGFGGNSMLTDKQGKRLPCSRVIAELIKYLKTDCCHHLESRLKHFSDTDVYWVVNGASFWNDDVIPFCTESARMAGISEQRLSIIQTPTAVYNGVRYVNEKTSISMDKFKAGTKFVVVDARNCAVVISAHEIMPNNDIKGSGSGVLSDCGGNNIRDTVETFFDEIFGTSSMATFRTQHKSEYTEFLKVLDLKIKTISLESDIQTIIRIPLFLQELATENNFRRNGNIHIPTKYSKNIKVKNETLSIDADLMRLLVGKTVEDIQKFTVGKLKDFNLKDISVLILIGGLSELRMLQDAIKRAFPAMEVLTPSENTHLIGDFVLGHRQIERIRIQGLAVSSPEKSQPKQPKVEIVSTDTSKSEHLFVAAIDFGTSYSGWAFSSRTDFKENPIKVSSKTWNNGLGFSQKAPTCILIEGDGKTLHSFGYEAESMYADLAETGCHKEWFFFKHFKMLLFGGIGMRPNVMLEDASGKKLPAKTVFALAIQYLKDDMLAEVNKRLVGVKDNDIRWVLTVPAIWNDAAKQFMREAAQTAHITGEQLIIALEPEAASIYCQYLPVAKEGTESLATFPEGTTYLVLDAGGGTVDITVHEVLPKRFIREVHKATGGAWGGTKVDEAFENLLGRILGKAVIAKLKDEHMEDYIGIFRNFEIKKREVKLDKEGSTIIHIPLALSDLVTKMTGCSVNECVLKSGYKKDVTVNKDKMKMSMAIMRTLFQDTVTKIIDHVEQLLKEPNVSDCTAIVMVGGFSESPMLQKSIKSRFHGLHVIIPEEAGLAIMKGAVTYGHKPNTVFGRVCKFTYGTSTTHETSLSCKHPNGKTYADKNGVQRCENIFSIHAKVGQATKIGEETEERIYTPIHDDQTSVNFDIYASTKETPYFVTEEGCAKIGEFSLLIPDTVLGRKREFGVSFIFAGTEIEVKVVDKSTREITIGSVNFLD